MSYQPQPVRGQVTPIFKHDSWIPTTFDAQAGEMVDHVVYGGALFALLHHLRFFGLASVVSLLGVLLGATLWETIEVIRYVRWANAGSPQPRPQACDQFSYKDIVRALVGAVVMLAVAP